MNPFPKSGGAWFASCLRSKAYIGKTKLTEMKHLMTLMALVVAVTAGAQGNCELLYDGNGDGAVNINDILGVLSEFGEECEAPINACGNEGSVTYNDYSYAIKEFGNQCWFTENLRTNTYRNGDLLPSSLNNDNWLYAEYGAVATPNNNVNFLCFGLLYNWYAVDDNRGICPAGWHVPSDIEWGDFELFIGMSPIEVDNWDERSNLAASIKSDTIPPAWDGSNATGFSAAPSGARAGWGEYVGTGFCDGQEVFSWTHFWTSTINSDPARPTIYPIERQLILNEDFIYRNISEKNYGFSVRCLKD